MKRKTIKEMSIVVGGRESRVLQAKNAQKKPKEIIIIRMGHTVASGEFNSKLLRPSCHV